MSRRLCVVLVSAAAALWCLFPASALGAAVTASTNEGGSCQIQTNATRATPNISYGVQIQPCTAHFGIRYAVSVGMAFDANKGEDQAGVMPRIQGGIPYANSRAFVISSPLNFGDPYFTRVDLSVILNSGAVATTTRHKRKCHRGDGNADDRGKGPGGDHDADDRKVCRRKVSTTTYQLEQWIDPGPDCIVTTTYEASDTLGCILVNPLP